MQRREWNGPRLIPKVGDKILVNFGASQCQELLEVTLVAGPSNVKRIEARKPPNTFTRAVDQETINFILGPTETLAATMWAGGWDDYIVDTAHIRPLTS